MKTNKKIYKCLAWKNSKPYAVKVIVKDGFTTTPRRRYTKVNKKLDIEKGSDIKRNKDNAETTKVA